MLRKLTVQVIANTREELVKAQGAIFTLLDKFDVRFKIEMDEGKKFGTTEGAEPVQPQILKKHNKRKYNSAVTDNPPVDESVATPEEKEMIVDHNLPKPNGGKPKPDWTEEDLRSAVQEIWKIPSGGQVAAQELMKKYHINRVSQIPEDRWGEFMSEATMLIVNLREKKN